MRLSFREIIGWESANDYTKTDPVYVYIYGFDSINPRTGESSIGNFFIRYGFKVYQANEIDGAVDIRNLIVKEYLIEKKREKKWIANLRKRKSALIKVA